MSTASPPFTQYHIILLGDLSSRVNNLHKSGKAATIFHDFFMTKKKEFPWPIGTAYFFKINDTRFMNAYQNKNISSFQLQTGWYLQKQKFQCIFTKNSRTSSSFSMTFHDLSCFLWLSKPENGLTKFHDFPGRVVTLYQSRFLHDNHCTIVPNKQHNTVFPCI